MESALKVFGLRTVFSENTRSAALSLLAGFAGALLLILMGHHPNDDAYITFRHARNFAQTGILSWNIVPPYEMGSTSPLFAFTLGVLGWLAGPQNIPIISLYLNALLIVILSLILNRYLRLLIKDEFAVFLIVLTVAVNSYNIRIYSQGFEAAIFSVIVFSGVYFAVIKKAFAAGLLAGMSLLIKTGRSVSHSNYLCSSAESEKDQSEVCICAGFPTDL